MSLVEDVFLQNEEAEALELERVIEGDEFEENRRSDSDDDSEKEDEAVEDKRRVDPAKQAKAKRVVKNPRVILNPARLTGPRGIQVIPEHFKHFKFKGKGHEKEDLDLVLKKLEHWAYRLYPKFQFDDCLKKIETLGKKRPVMVHLHKIRSDQYLSDDVVVQKDSSDEEAPRTEEPEDEFDKLLGEQIELARAKADTPGSVKKGFQTPSTVDKRTPLLMPKATSSPSLSEEQRERMLLNKKLAEERRLARLKQNTTNVSDNIINNVPNNAEINVSGNYEIDEQIAKKHNKSNVFENDEDDTENVIRNDIIDEKVIEKNTAKKYNISNVIDSSDEESAENNVITVDLHEETNKHTKNINEDITVFTDHIDLTNVRPKGIDTNEGDITIDLVNTESNNVIKESLVFDITGQELTNVGPKRIVDTVDLSDIEEQVEINNIMKKRRSKTIIESSDEECDISSVNNEISVEIHNNLEVEKTAENINSATKNIDENLNFNEEIHNDEEFTKIKRNLNYDEKEMDFDSNTESNGINNSKNKTTDDFDKLSEDTNTNTNKEIDHISLEENQNESSFDPSIGDANACDDTEIKESKEKIDDIEVLMDIDFSEDF